MDSIANVDAVLKQDLLARNDREVCEVDIYSLSSLHNKEWNFELPTLSPHEETKQMSTEVDTIIARFFMRYGSFKDVDMKNILIAGGSVVSCLLDIEENVDVDLFIYGISLDEVPRRVERLLYELRLPEHGDIVKTAFATTVTYKVDGMRRIIQIIHRLYRTASEVLHGFDLGSCAVGILLDQKNIITTSLGKFSLEYKINILDLAKRSTTHSVRLKKYFRRGFSIVFPDLNIEKMRNSSSEVFHLQDLRIALSYIRWNNMTGKIFITNCKCNCDYENMYWTKSIGDRSNSFNQSALLTGKELCYYREWSGREDLIRCLYDSRVIVEGTLRYCYPFSVGNINQKRLISIFGTERAAIFASRLIMANEEETREIIDEILFHYKEKIQELIESYNEQGGYVPHWKTLDPGSQITGSFRPVEMTKKEFYGPYMKE